MWVLPFDTKGGNHSGRRGTVAEWRATAFPSTKYAQEDGRQFFHALTIRLYKREPEIRLVLDHDLRMLPQESAVEATSIQ